MKLKELSKENIRVSIEENKELALPIVILLIAVMLFIVFILPNILSFPSRKGERDVEVEKLNQIKTAQKILQSTNTSELESEVGLVSNVLPSEKNFELILEAIKEAGAKSNSQIINYQFTDSGIRQVNTQSSIPSLLFTIDIVGGVDQAANFASELYNIYPISSLKSISLINGVSEVNVNFYYKPFTSVNASDVALARDKTTNEEKALQKISQWNQIDVSVPEENSQPATQSASPF